MRFFERIFKTKKNKLTDPMKMNFSPMQAEKLLQMIQNTKEVELSCDEVHALLDQYTEMANRGEEVATLLPLVHFHLDMCPDCREEYEALSRILNTIDNQID
ncbi:MAG: hypothetical protein AAGU04_01055 [Anaerolineaceae bacterium]